MVAGDNKVNHEPACYTQCMIDTVRPSPTPSDAIRHSLSLPELEIEVAKSGIVMSRRQLMRHCQAGVFNAKKLPAANNVPAWFIAPESIAKGIADLKALQEFRTRQTAVLSDTDGHRPTTFDTSEPQPSQISDGHSRTETDYVETKTGSKTKATQLDDVRPSPSVSDVEPTPVAQVGIDIFEHPYVKKLERDIDKIEQRYDRDVEKLQERYVHLEGRYDAQVKETQAILERANHQLVELQKASQVAQSKTLAEYLLRAKDFILGGKTEHEEQGSGHGAQLTS